jgi:hypothetical protein
VGFFLRDFNAKTSTAIASNMARPSKSKSLSEKIAEVDNATPKGLVAASNSSSALTSIQTSILKTTLTLTKRKASPNPTSLNQTMGEIITKKSGMCRNLIISGMCSGL